MGDNTSKKKLTGYAEVINNECFWEYDFSNSDIIQMARYGTEQEKMFLFTKIMENAGDVLKSLNIFSPGDQHELLRKYHVSDFKHNFLGRRHKILKHIITDEEVDIPELKWSK